VSDAELIEDVLHALGDPVSSFVGGRYWRAFPIQRKCRGVTVGPRDGFCIRACVVRAIMQPDRYTYHEGIGHRVGEPEPRSHAWLVDAAGLVRDLVWIDAADGDHRYLGRAFTVTELEPWRAEVERADRVGEVPRWLSPLAMLDALAGASSLAQTRGGELTAS
jgi:hypothetical protein